MTTALRLRPYQTESIAALFTAWGTGMRRPAVVLPTGMGKTVIFASLIDQWLADPYRPPGAILVLVHREELAAQTADKIHMVNDGITVGVCKAERNELGGQVIVGSIQTLARENRRRQLPRIGLVIVDECHHASADSYLKILDHVGALDHTIACTCGQCQSTDQGALAAGFTATMTRSDRRGLGTVWDEIVYTKDIMWGITHNDHGQCAPGAGYLTDARGVQLKIDGLDLRSVAIRQGDYADGAVADAYEGCDALTKIAEGYKEHAADRSGIVFMPTVATAEEYAAEASRLGMPTAFVHGGTPTEDRKLIYKQLATGDVQAVSNCGVLTEGFDEPRVSVVVPKLTASEGLYIQMVGRGLRPYPGKTDCLVLDPTGVSGRLSLCGTSVLTDGTIAPKDGETLAEAEARQEAEALEAAGKVAEAKARRKLAGQLTAEMVDLFHGSTSAWLQTTGGVWFIPTRKWTFFLWPDGTDGHWKIGRCGVYNARGGQWLKGELTFEYAMAIAEQLAREADSTVSQRAASWRKGLPSETQIGLAERLGIDATDMRRGTLSDAISIHYASKILDRGKR
jgi:superfamily II DNA or RNA helicase